MNSGGKNIKDDVLKFTVLSIVEAASENTSLWLPTKPQLRYNKFMKWKKFKVKLSFS